MLVFDMNDVAPASSIVPSGTYHRYKPWFIWQRQTSTAAVVTHLEQGVSVTVNVKTNLANCALTISSI